jgi:hypothetical protein
MNKIIFIADFFSNQVLGGGELNNEELIVMLRNVNFDVVEINSQNVTINFLKENEECFFIIANFAFLNIESIKFISKNCKFVIYEHDHKYLKNRNPGLFDNFLAPKSELANVEFYKNAKAVLLQSELHKQIVFKNLNLNNLVNLGGNLWSIKTLELLEKLSYLDKQDSYAIMDSQISHKNTFEAKRYCEFKKYDYNLVKSSNYVQFLQSLGKNKGLVFFPKTPETLSRIVVESRMMGMSIITNNIVGATSENWYSLKGKELIQIMYEKREQILNIVMESIS